MSISEVDVAKLALVGEIEAQRSLIVNADSVEGATLTPLVRRLEELKEQLDELRLRGGQCNAVSVR